MKYVKINEDNEENHYSVEKEADVMNNFSIK